MACEYAEIGADEEGNEYLEDEEIYVIEFEIPENKMYEKVELDVNNKINFDEDFYKELYDLGYTEGDEDWCSYFTFQYEGIIPPEWFVNITLYE